jgi:hypothetical protein
VSAAPTPGNGQGQQPAIPVDPAVLKPFIDAYYTRGLAATDRARDRAEKGYTIASAIAAALVAAGVFTDLPNSDTSVKVLGLTGLFLWLVAAMLFIWVVSVPVRAPKEQDWTTADDFVGGVIADIRYELSALRKRLFGALIATLLATIVTIAAFAVATALPTGSDPEKARIALTAKEDTALADLCTAPVGAILGTVDPDNLDEEFVEIKVPAGACNATETTIRVPKSAILGEQKLTRFPRLPR